MYQGEIEIKELASYRRPAIPTYKSWLDDLPFLEKHRPDQGISSTCVSFAITFVVSFLNAMENLRFTDLPHEMQVGIRPEQWVLSVQDPVDRVPSLYEGRVKTATYQEDITGAAAVRCYEVYEYGVDFGYTFERDSPYREGRNRFNKIPSSNEVPRVHIDDFQVMGSCVGVNRLPIYEALSKQALVGLLAVTKSFENCRHIYRRNTEDIDGYHAVAIVGYDDELNLLQIYNSWKNWGIPDRPGSLWVEADLFFGISRPLKSSLISGVRDKTKIPRPREKRPWKYNIGWGEGVLVGCSVVDEMRLKEGFEHVEPIDVGVPGRLLDLGTRVLAATSNTFRAPHCTLLAWIAYNTDTVDSRETILDVLMSRLEMPYSESWRSLYKTLILFEYLVGNGSAAIVEDILHRRDLILEKVHQTLHRWSCSLFRYFVEDKLDQLVDLWSDSAHIDTARDRGSYSRNMYMAFRSHVRVFGFA